MHIYSTPRAPYYRSQRSHDILLTAATVLELLDEDGDEYIYLCGRMLDTKTITQTRKTVEEMFSQLGGYAKQAWKSDLDRFNEMHETLRLYLEEEFGVGECLEVPQSMARCLPDRGFQRLYATTVEHLCMI
jgi:hypothetical protein